MVALAAVFAGSALTASLIYRARASRHDAGVGPSPGTATPRRSASADASAPVAGEDPPLLRTTTLEVNEPPPPGQSGPARPLPRPDADADAVADLPAPPKDYASKPALDALPDAASSGATAASADGPAGSRAAGAASVPATRSARAAAPPAGTRGTKGPPRSSDAGLLDSDTRLSAREASLVHQAKDFKVAGNANGPVDFSNPQSIRSAIMKQQAIESSVDSDLRKHLDALGPDADIEQKRQATADVLAAHGQPAGEQDITNALGTAMQPPGATSPAGAPPDAMDNTVNSSVVPHPPPGRGPAQPPVGPEWRPTGPPPADAMKAYQMYKSDFDAALQRYGVRPEHILALGQQESDFGKNMGRTPELKAVAPRPADFKAVNVLAARGSLPAAPANLRGSETGALGPWQFQPATCISVACKPFDWHQLISDSVPRLLQLDGYKPNNQASQHQAFCRYYGKCADRHADYANDIDRKAANIRAGLERLGQSGPVAAAAKQ